MFLSRALSLPDPAHSSPSAMAALTQEDFKNMITAMIPVVTQAVAQAIHETKRPDEI